MVLQFVPLVPDFTDKTRLRKFEFLEPFDCKAVLFVGERSNVPLYVVAPSGGLMKGKGQFATNV